MREREKEVVVISSFHPSQIKPLRQNCAYYNALARILRILNLEDLQATFNKESNSYNGAQRGALFAR